MSQLPPLQSADTPVSLAQHPQQYPAQYQQPYTPLYSTAHQPRLGAPSPGTQGQTTPSLAYSGRRTVQNNRAVRAGLGIIGLLALLIILVVLLWPRNDRPAPVIALPPEIASATSQPAVAAAPPTLTPVPVKTMPPISIEPYGYEEKTNQDGWKIAAVGLYFINRTDKPVIPETLHVESVEVQTSEGKSYPAAIISPDAFWGGTLLSGNSDYLSGGQYRDGGDLGIWDQPVGVPPGFPIVTSGIGFRFAEASHPQNLVLKLQDYGELTISLANSSAGIKDPSPQDVGAIPISELPSHFSVNNDQFSFQFEGRCISRIEEMVRNKMVYIPYHITNKNALDQTNASVKFDFALYGPGGSLSYTDYEAGEQLGPGQSADGLHLIDLLISENDPLPLYLIHYTDPTTITVYQLNCSEPANK